MIDLLKSLSPLFFDVSPDEIDSNKLQSSALPLCNNPGIDILPSSIIYGCQFVIYTLYLMWTYRSFSKSVNNWILFVFFYMGFGFLLLCADMLTYHLYSIKDNDKSELITVRLIVLTVEFVML